MSRQFRSCRNDQQSNDADRKNAPAPAVELFANGLPDHDGGHGEQLHELNRQPDANKAGEPPAAVPQKNDGENQAREERAERGLEYFISEQRPPGERTGKEEINFRSRKGDRLFTEGGE